MKRILEQMREEHKFQRFDTFLMAYLGFASREVAEETENVRKQAYHKFLNQIGEDKPASLPTMRRWFGIRDFKAPSREQVIRMAFALGLDVATAELFLKEGTHEPSFQINDYTEIIAMYCLENRRNYGKYESMVAEYERNLSAQQEISHEFNTQWLYQQFEHIKQASEEEFMYWMWEHAKLFKGYSKTVQVYLNKYRDSVLGYMRQDAKRRLDLLLSETEYEEWRKKKRFGKDMKEVEWIRKYASRHVSQNMYENIMELAKLAYSEAGLNTKLLAELYDGFATGKYLSDLFNIPQRHEMDIHVKQALRELEQMDETAACEEHISDMVEQYSRGALAIENAGEAYEWLKEFDRESKRRRLVVKRNDLLPMILYVAQQRYLLETEDKEKDYNQKEALRVFRDLADATMIACNMAPLNENYLFDMTLISCYQEDEMYGYGEVVELV